MHDVLIQLAIYLAAAVVAVPISQRLGFGSVLGYLAAGHGDRAGARARRQREPSTCASTPSSAWC